MERSFRALVVIVVFVMAGFVLGGWVGREVGRRSPSFVAALELGPPHSQPKNLDTAEFGQGLGMVFGLFFGAGAGLVVTFLNGVREIWIERWKLLGPKHRLD